MEASWIGRLALLGLLCSISRVGHAGEYVFATFTGDPLANERLSTYRSSNALDFSLVSNTGFSGPSGALRDPSITRHSDGQYYVAYTDPIGAGCCGKEDHFSVARSADLVHWTQVTTVPAAVSNVAHVWAPEWFVEGSVVHVIANIDTLNNDTDFKPYVFTALDATLTRWSGPTPVGIGPNYIDTFVLETAGKYHLFAKNETTRYLEHATASALTGPWTFVGTGNWAGWGSGMEGPCVVKLDDGTWRIYLDGQGSVGFLYANSPDLMSWSKTSPLPMLSNLVRHGTVLRDPGVGGAVGAAGTAGAAGATAAGGISGSDGGQAHGGPGGHAGGNGSGGQSGTSGGSSGSGGAAGTTGTGGLAVGPDAGGSGGVRAGQDAAAGGASLPTSDSGGGCSCVLSGKSRDWSQGPLTLVVLLRRARRRRGASGRGV